MLIPVTDRYQPENRRFHPERMQEHYALPGGLKMLNSDGIKCPHAKEQKY
jgi:hypothetical protein